MENIIDHVKFFVTAAKKERSQSFQIALKKFGFIFHIIFCYF